MMKGICLIREDETAGPIKLTLGEVVIGRGPLLECIDKRVSRKHGLLKLSDDGNILLTAIHSSPCYTTCENNEKKVLLQGKSITLQDGDRFSLLPDSYCYRVTFTDGMTERKSINAEEKFHSESATENDKTVCEVIDENKDCEVKPHKINIVEMNGTTACEKDKIAEKRTSSLQGRKRVLPLWMLKDNEDAATSNKTIKMLPKTKRKEASSKRMQSAEKPDPLSIKKEQENGNDQLPCVDTANEAQNNTKLHSISEDEESNPETSNGIQESVKKSVWHEISDSEQSDIEQETNELENGDQQQNASSSAKPLWMLKDNEDAATSKKTIKMLPKTKRKEASSKRMQFAEKPDPLSIKKEQENGNDQLTCADTTNEGQNNTKLHSISEDEESNPETSNDIQESVKKPVWHGISDNEQSDIEQETDELENGDQQQIASSSAKAVQAQPPNVTKQKREQCKYAATCYRKNPQHREEFSHPGDEDFEDDSNKPECPYGVSCYRKNQLHRQNFRHTATPAKPKAQRKTKKKDNTGYESEEDSYDEEDPFINNASSDDYQPTDSDSDSEVISDADKEDDTRRMLKEAKRFVKKR